MANRVKYVNANDPSDYIERIDSGGATGQTFKRRSPFGKRWNKMAFMGLEAVALEDLTGTDLRVFLMIVPSIHDGNMVYVNVHQLSKALRIHRTAVSRSIRRLIEIDVLERLDTMAGRVLRLNPNYAWYGPDNGAHTQAVRQWNQSRTIQ